MNGIFFAIFNFCFIKKKLYFLKPQKYSIEVMNGNGLIYNWTETIKYIKKKKF